LLESSITYVFHKRKSNKVIGDCCVFNFSGVVRTGLKNKQKINKNKTHKKNQNTHKKTTISDAIDHQNINGGKTDHLIG